MPRTAETDVCLRPDPGAVEPEVSIRLAHAILRLSIKKEESEIFLGEWRNAMAASGVHELLILTD
jgi:hypothetical protein